MTDFTGVKCPVCGVPFQPEDDIVVCPECGAPYHRACYQQEGHCIFEDKHGTAWQFPDERTNPSGDTVRCPKCGHDNTAGALFCEHCGTPFPNRTPAVKTVSSLLTILHLIIKVPMASTQTAGLTIRHPLLLTQWQVLIQMKQLIM